MQDFLQNLNDLSVFILPLIIVGLPVYGLIKGVPVYESFVEGAKDGFKISVSIIPYLVAIIFAIGVFRASGALDALVEATRAPLAAIGFPSEVLPMAVARPLTGSGSLAILADTSTQYGPQHLFTRISAVMFGSTETTFYVLAVYFGAVNVTKTRHAALAGLSADFAGFVGAVLACRLLLG